MLELKKIMTATAAALMLAAANVSAGTLTYDLDREFSGATPPSGSGTWLRAIFTDVAPNTVELRLQTVGLTNTEYVSGWFFNLGPNDGSPLPSDFTSVQTAGVAGTFSKGLNAFKADGDGWFDFKYDFPNAPAASRFTGASPDAVFTLTGTGIDSLSFFYLSLGDGNSPDGLYTAAHVQGIDPNGNFSGWITTTVHIIPLPTATALTLCGLLVVGGTRRRRS
jgi:hypothetical protein